MSDVSKKFSMAVYRLIDLLEETESDIRNPQIEQRLETILSANQARLAITDLELSTDMNLKTFLAERVKLNVAKRDNLN